MLKVHIQNATAGTRWPKIFESDWKAAMARHPDMTGRLALIGVSDERDALERALPDVEVLITANPELPTWLSPDAPRQPQIIYFNLSGVDMLAPFGWLPSGTRLWSNKGTQAEKASQYALMAILMLMNKVPQLLRSQQQRRWEKHYGSVARRCRLTVLGLGHIGGASAHLAAHLGMEVTGVRRVPRPHQACARVVALTDLDEVLPTTDILLIATPLTPTTRRLINRERLARLPRGAGLINIGRGAVLDEDAICDALDSGALGGAVLDVFDPEPVAVDHRYWRTRNLIVTPHVSAYDPSVNAAASLDILMDSLRAYLQDQPVSNEINRDAGY